MSASSPEPDLRAYGELLAAIARTRVLVAGDVMLDHYIWGDCLRISPEAPVPVVAVEGDTFAGGGAANVSLNLAALGAETYLCGRTGADEAGERVGSILREKRVQPLPTPPAPQTLEKIRVMARNQQLCRIDREAAREGYALAGVGLEEGLAAALAACRAIIASDYAKGAITPAWLEWARGEASRHGIPLALDPKPALSDPVPGLDLLTPNRAEALRLAGLPERSGRGEFPVAEVCRRIRQRWEPRFLVVTLGPEGMVVSEEAGDEEVIPTYARSVFDVSGAGDTVVAALTAALAAGADLRTAACLANRAAGVVVGKVGTATAAPEEILAHRERHPAG
jgi:D-beta-D-heptose 7-phosphate kinase/D-beta-D-heptose 1-phosphate adenosyltransferase